MVRDGETFTLGGLEELSGDGVRCLIAVDADRTVHGITSWLPVYADGEVVGGTLNGFVRSQSSAASPTRSTYLRWASV